jgi:hypothetical protein
VTTSPAAAIKKFIPTGVKRTLRHAWQALRRPHRMSAAARVVSRHGARAGRPVILFFTPEAGVAPYLIMQSYLARTLREQGCDVLFVRCFDLLPRCPVKDMVRLSYTPSAAERHDACLFCLDNSRRILDRYGLDFVDLREIIDRDALAALAGKIPRGTEDRLGFHYQGVNVGRLAFYDYAIASKHPVDLALDADALSRLDSYILNAVIAIEIFDRLRQSFSIASIACFDVYAMMTSVRLRAREFGIPSAMVRPAYHLNADPTRLICTPSLSSVEEQQRLLSRWDEWKDLPLAAELIAEITDDLVHRLSGSGTHIYSPNRTLDPEKLYRSLNLDPARKLVVAYTSSRDEHDAMLFSLQGLGGAPGKPNDAFSGMYDWLHALTDHVERSADLQLVIRIHPRVGSTPRDGVASPDYSRSRAEFSRDYRHCRVIWPDQDVSSYDIAEFADLVTIAWSSIGLEAARMGIPVLSGHRSILSIGPGSGFIWHADTPEKYFDLLESLIRPGSTSIASVTLALRWYRMAYMANAIDLTDSGLSMTEQPDYRLPRNALQVQEVLQRGRDAVDFNLASERQRLRALGEKARREELAAVRAQVARFVAFICTGRDPRAGATLQITDALPGARGQVSLDGVVVRYHDGHDLHVKRSPLAARLVRMHASP